MYSPFCIVTPSRTPNKIRMGIHEPKRYVNFLDKLKVKASSLIDLVHRESGLLMFKSVVCEFKYVVYEFKSVVGE